MNEIDTIRRMSGLIAWAFLVTGISGWDAYAMKTGKVETMSSSWWKSLEEPPKAFLQMLAMGWLVWHLMLNPVARKSHTVSIYTVKSKFGTTKIIKEQI